MAEVNDQEIIYPPKVKKIQQLRTENRTSKMIKGIDLALILLIHPLGFGNLLKVYAS